MTHDEVEELGKNIHREFDMKNKALVRSADQALMELIFATPLPDQKSFREIAAIRFADLKSEGLIPETFEEDDNEEIMTMLEKRISDDIEGYHGINVACMDTSSMGAALGLLLGGESLTKDQQRFLDSRASYYRNPLTSTEIRKATLTVVNELLKFDLGAIIGRNEDSVGHIYDAAMATVRKYPEVRSILISLLQKHYITSEDSDMRCFLDKNVDKKVKDAKLYKLVIDIIQKDPDFFKFVICVDSDILDKYIKPYDRTLYESMMSFRVFGANALKDIYKK